MRSQTSSTQVIISYFTFYQAFPQIAHTPMAILGWAAPGPGIIWGLGPGILCPWGIPPGPLCRIMFCTYMSYSCLMAGVILTGPWAPGIRGGGGCIPGAPGMGTPGMLGIIPGGGPCPGWPDWPICWLNFSCTTSQQNNNDYRSTFISYQPLKFCNILLENVHVSTDLCTLDLKDQDCKMNRSKFKLSFN